MEKKILFNVLREIRNGGTGLNSAPDEQYLRAMETLGFINLGWDKALTSFGVDTFNYLNNLQWK